MNGAQEVQTGILPHPPEGFADVPPPVDSEKRGPGRPAKVPGTKAPLDPEKRARQAKRAAVRRRLNELQKAKDLEELESIFREGKPGNTSSTPQPAPVSPPPPAPQKLELNIPLKDLVKTAFSTYQLLVENVPELRLDNAKRDALVQLWMPIAEKYEEQLAASPEMVAVVGTAAIIGPGWYQFLTKPKGMVRAVPEQELHA